MSQAIWQPVVFCVGVSLLCNVATVFPVSGFVQPGPSLRLGHLLWEKNPTKILGQCLFVLNFILSSYVQLYIFNPPTLSLTHVLGIVLLQRQFLASLLAALLSVFSQPKHLQDSSQTGHRRFPVSHCYISESWGGKWGCSPATLGSWLLKPVYILHSLLVTLKVVSHLPLFG